MAPETTPIPGTHKIGNWVELEYTNRMVYRGIEWLQTDFGRRGDRIDWVANLPSQSVSTSRYLSGSYSNGWNYGMFEHLSDAMDNAIVNAFSYLEDKIDAAIEEIRGLAEEQHILRKAIDEISPRPEAQ